MNIYIKINCDNSAFFPHLAPEVSRILQQLAKKFDSFPSIDNITEFYNDFPISDTNGSKVGRVEFESD